MNPLWGFAGVLLFGLTIRLVAGAFDRGRIQSYLEDMGCKLISKKWEPLGPGWQGGNMRIYKIVYSDTDGAIHRAYAKTSTMGGVYLSHDRVIKDASRSVEDEKAELRRRLEELEQH
jgi:hypothetical protein